MPEPQLLFLIDGHALLYRAYFAIKNLSTSYGQATNAVFGFVSTLKKIVRDYHPQYLAICFDAGKKTLRQQRFQEYKIHRPSMPEDLISQIPLVKDVVEAYRLPAFELEGFEADDLICTLTKQAQRQGWEVVIVSDDKDMMQLVNENVKILSTRKQMLLGSQEVQDLFGIAPGRMPDYIGLAGDQTDNIPGVLGIGGVTARKLLQEFGSLEEIFAHIERVQSPKVKEKLLQQKEMALFSRDLAVLDEKVPVSFELDSLKIEQPDKKRLFEIFQKLEFKKMAEELAGEMTLSAPVTVKKIETQGECEDLLSRILQEEEFSFLLQCADPSDYTSCEGIVLALHRSGAGLACPAPSPQNESAVLPTGAHYLPLERLSEMKSIFEAPSVIKVTHDVKQAMKAFETHRCPVRGKIFDVMLAGYLLDPSQRSYDAAGLAWNYLKRPLPPLRHPSEEAAVILELYPVMLRELKEKSLLKLFEQIEMPLAYVLFRMETSGVRVDEKLLGQLSLETQKKIRDL